MTGLEIKDLLDYWAKEVEENAFIEFDPVQIPHRYSRLQDIEIAGFFAAIMAWGQRKTIIKSAQKLMLLMDDAPFDFITQHEPSDLKRFQSFVHRTLNGEDVVSMISFFRQHYQTWSAFPHERRTDKHLASPLKGSACKRLNMYFRWMVRQKSPVDFGIWSKVSMSELLCPLDVHVQRIAIEMGLLHRDKSDWQSCMELTNRLREFRPHDPVFYDYALFGIGVAKMKEIIL